MYLAKQLRTTTFLLTLRYMVLLFVSVSIVVGIINWSAVGYFEQEADATIRAEVRGLREQFNERGPQRLAQVIETRIVANPEGDALYLLADAELRKIIGNLEQWPQLAPAGESMVMFDHTDANGDKIPARAQLFMPNSNLRLLVGRNVRALEQLSRLFDRTLFWALGVTLALAFIGGLFMSGNVLRRVNEINATSRQIMQGNLSRRVSTRGTGDEFDELARNLNTMLDQIESLMSSIQHISDNIAHDLRTPLTRLRNRLEDLRHDSTNEHETAEIDACLDNADALLSTFNSLLRIARIESGTYESSLDPVDLGKSARDAYELYKALADEKSIILSCDAPGINAVSGDRNLIFQALTNLLDNAIKYTPQGGAVAITVEKTTEDVTLTVSDSGAGIPEDMREKVLQRLFRLDKSRSEPGAGLGLSLVKAIALRHKAMLLLEDNDPGLRVKLVFTPI
jgi:signal transduction histidine kinase